jgi:hypothetical protein
MTRIGLLPVLGSCALFALAPPSPALAQGAGSQGWSGRLVPSLWLSNVTGRSGTAGFEIPVRDSVLRAGGAVRLELWKGHWGALSGFSRATAVGHPTPDRDDGLAGTYHMGISTLQAEAGFRVGRVPVTSAVELLAGVRYVRHDWDLDLSAPRPSSGRTVTDWVEPRAGVRFVSALGGPFRFSVSGAIGGFGLGSAFSWTLKGDLELRLLSHARLVSGYRYTESEYDGSETRYSWNGRAQGWLLGLGIDL